MEEIWFQMLKCTGRKKTGIGIIAEKVRPLSGERGGRVSGGAVDTRLSSRPALKSLKNLISGEMNNEYG